MLALLSAISRLIGIGGVLFIGLLLYEEGIPGASRVPFLANVPVVGDLITGRVHTFAADQVRLATATARAQCYSRIEKLVSRSELTAANAKAAQLQRQIEAMNEAMAAYQKRALADQQSLKVENDRLEKAIAEDAGDNGCTWTPDDFQWLQDHRGRAGGSAR
ncbi:hypothetical protein [Rhizobium chutanense]|uniref:Uncharacterized protein n=1 Tax=Rhizobium chutanense TaxID=2035448 RepID=A0A3S0T4K8_9HYPH|nr:hypothetical protein [Rhizobium chutanense]RUM06829.1 hypothetical protein EFR84_11580 [Rhizobium chutanense]